MLCARLQNFESRFVESGGLGTVRVTHGECTNGGAYVHEILHFPADFSLLPLLVELSVDGRCFLSDDLGLMHPTDQPYDLGVAYSESSCQTNLFNCKLLVGLDLDFPCLFPRFLRDERNLIEKRYCVSFLSCRGFDALGAA